MRRHKSAQGSAEVWGDVGNRECLESHASTWDPHNLCFMQKHKSARGRVEVWGGTRAGEALVSGASALGPKVTRASK